MRIELRSTSCRILLATAVALGISGCSHDPPAEESARSLLAPSSVRGPSRRPELVEAASGFTLAARVSHPLVRLDGSQLVHLHLGIEVEHRPPVTRPGLNVALVIDRSGSMGSDDALDHAVAAAEQFVARMGERDRLAVVAYDSSVDTLIPSTSTAEREPFLRALRGLRPGGSTDLHGGLVRGAEEVRQNSDGRSVARVLLLSDGLANYGVRDPGAILERASQLRVDGVQVSTMGMGLEYDEDLLTGIAQRAGGAYTYVDDVERIADDLEREFASMTDLVARDLECELRLGRGIEVVDVPGYAWTVAAGRVRFPLRDLVGGDRRKVVLTLRVPGSGEEREALLAEGVLAYRSSDGETSSALQIGPVTVVHEDDPARIRDHRDLEVLAEAEVVQNAVAMDEAMRLQREGLFEEAIGLLSARYRVSSALNDAELSSAEVAELLDVMRDVMREIENTRHDPAARRHLQLDTQLRALGYVSEG